MRDEKKHSPLAPRSSPLRRLIVTITCALAAILLPASANGRTIASYDAGTGSTVWNPSQHWLWLAEDIRLLGDPLAAPMADDEDSGLNAWAITDNAVGFPNPAYVTSLDFAGGQLVNELLDDGWRFTARARLVSDFGGGPGMGLNVYLGGRAYIMLLDFSATGGLQAILFDTVSRVHPLTAPGPAATAFHTFELRADGGAEQVAFLFDNQEIARWSGVAALHPNIIRWGSSTANNRGQMNFHRVEFAALETNTRLPGDYNGDGQVDASDYTVWRDHLGSNFAAADGNQNGTVDQGDFGVWKAAFGGSPPSATTVPEPAPLSLFVLVISGWALQRNTRRLLLQR